MTNHFRTALGGLLLLGAVPLALAGCTQPADGNDQSTTETLKVTVNYAEPTMVDLGDEGQSAGDRFIVFGTVVQDGQEVGTAAIQCDSVLFTAGSDPQGAPAADTGQCWGSLTLPKGQLVLQGLVDHVGPVPYSVPITGGTGEYREARGEMQTSGPSDEGVEELTLTVIH